MVNMIQKMHDTHFSDNIFWNMYHTQSPFSLLNGRLFIIGPQGKTSHGFLSIGQCEYGLYESDHLNDLEGKLLLKHKESITDSILSKTTQRISELPKTKSSNTSLTWIDPNEQYLSWDVYNAVYQIPNDLLENCNVTPPETPTTETVYNTILQSKIWKQTIPNPGIVVIGNTCYQVTDPGDTRTLIYNDRKYGLSSIFSLDNLAHAYGNNIEKSINQCITNSLQSLVMYYNSLQDRNKKIQQANAIRNKYLSGKLMGYSFKKNKAHAYTITFSIPPYIIKKNNVHYPFPSATFHFPIQFNNNMWSISKNPSVIHPYNHPFVFSWKDDNLCFGANRLTNRSNLIHNTQYACTPQNARKIASYILHTQLLLEESYKGIPGTDFGPVNLIELISKPLTTQSEIQYFLKKNNIDKNRIFDQDS